jgi:uncharacterized protein (DUF1800 family)
MGSMLTALPARDWTAGTARHLLNRAGFGVPAAAVERLAGMGRDKAISAFVEFDAYRDNAPKRDFLVKPLTRDEIRELYAGLSQEERAKKRAEIRRAERQAIERLRMWWLRQMQVTTRPLQEKLALFWHGHFATSAQKVQSSAANSHILDVFRMHGAGNFETLVTEVGKSPAMLQYLDNTQNVRGKPNENWARELLELFTIGIGNYTEKDIKEAARAFTGWTFEGADGFRFNIAQHDFGAKTFMGQRGLFEGRDIIRIVLEQPATATFIARKLWEYFAYPDPSAELVDELGAVFREAKYDIKALLRTVFTSREFYSERAMRQQIKSPAQYVVQLIDALDVNVFSESAVSRYGRQAYTLLVLTMARMGQNLFYPPNVKGWEGNRAWINTNTLLARYNFAGFLINGRVDTGRRRLELDETESDLDRLEREFQQLRQASAPFEPERFFAQYDGKPVGEMIDAVAQHFDVALDRDQRRVIINALDAADARGTTRFFRAAVGTNRLRGVVHLVVSAAEAQLC